MTEPETRAGRRGRAWLAALALFLLAAAARGGDLGWAETPRENRGPVHAWLEAERLETGVREVEAAYGEWASLAIRAVCFLEENDTPALPENLKEWPFPFAVPPVYLTVTNELRTARQTLPADPGLVGRLLDSPRENAARLAALVAGRRYAGLELDFLNVPADFAETYWDFCRRLQRALAANGQRLRVVLTPAPDLPPGDFPEEIEYVVRALPSGAGTAPGPRLLPGRFARLGEMCRRLPGEPILLLPLGGGHWIKKPHSADRPRDRMFFYSDVDEAAAWRMSAARKTPTERDRTSRYRLFGFMENEESGSGRLRRHYLWFADAETFRYWAGLAYRAGFRRVGAGPLGGNRPETLAAAVRNLRQMSSIAAEE